MTATRCPRDERGNCNDDHCTTCNTWHLDDGERQTCIRCLGATRRAIKDITEYAPLLPDQAINGQNPEPHGELKIPGGDALVMMLAGSDEVHGLRAKHVTRPDLSCSCGYTDPTIKHEPRSKALADAGPAAYSYPSDPNPPGNQLMTWEDDWRHVLHLPAATGSTLTDVADFLLDKLNWAAEHHPAFPQFSHEVRTAARHLEQALHAGIRDEIGAYCIRCDNPPRLRARYADPGHEPTGLDVRHQIGGAEYDQGGRRDYWECPKCHEVYSPRDYLNAKGDEMHEQAIG